MQEALSGSFHPVLVEEYREVAVRKRVRRHVIGRLLNLIREAAEEVQPRIAGRFSPDPKDEVFFQCAVAGRADFIVTLNPKDFPHGKQRFQIVSPAELLSL